MIAAPAWTMARFTGLQDGPVYIDLHQVTAVTEAYAPNQEFWDEAIGGPKLLPGMPIGARVVLQSGVALFTKESADTVFEEVHRARTQAPPEPEHIRVGDAPL